MNPVSTVLVVEDDADTRANLGDLLTLDGYQIEFAKTLGEGLAFPRAQHLDFVILDRRLPDGLAEQKLSHMRQAAPHAAIIIITAYADLDGVIAALREGADDYLLKPINPELFRRRLDQLRRQRRLAEETRRSEDAFRALVESAGCMIVILDARHRITYFNAFSQELTGYSADEAVGQDFFDLLFQADERQRCEGVFDCVLPGAQLRNFRTWLRRQDGGRAEVVWNACGLDREPHEGVLLAVGQDITSLAEAQRRALQAERLAAIGQMVTGLAHESRNALQRSQACLEMLELEIEGNAPALNLVQRIEKAQDQLKTLFDEVRGYAAPIQLDRHECALAEVWREAWESLAAQRAGRDATLREQLLDGDPRVQIDRFRMVQVFRNLLENALAAGPEPILVDVICQRAVHRGVDALRIVVRDNGPGLNAEQRARIFEPFYTTKTHGTGLGMPIAKRIVDAHGGELTVGSETVPGAEFVVVLPRTQP